MDRNEIDWKGGRVTWWGCDIEELDLTNSAALDIYEFDEDLAQIEDPGGYVLDISWYPRSKDDAGFQVWVVLQDDPDDPGKCWDSPLFRRGCKSPDQVIILINTAIEFIEHRLRESGSE
jgi:hypothetical protein